MARIRIPNNWTPRDYQLPAWKYLEDGGKRACLVCHRRWGKDDLALHWAAVAAMQRPATYWHMLPIAAQARKAIWKAVNPHTGKRRIDEAFPKEIRTRTNDQEMFIELKGGATWQVIGSDNYNSLVGSPPAGIVLSEWALADPNAWAYLSPILAENEGWALFIYTSRGRNHGYSTYKQSITNPKWFSMLHTVNDTNVFTEDALIEAKNDLYSIYKSPDVAEMMYQQEYFCSFEGAIPGSYYGMIIAQMEREGRLTQVPYDSTMRVHTAWDIGVSDSTSIWFFQRGAGGEIRIIDHYKASGVGIDHYIGVLEEKNYIYGEHIAPHDIKVREFGSGKSRLEIARNLGINFRIAREVSIYDGIQAVRSILPRCYFDHDKCETGIESLRQYHCQFDEKRNDFMPHPVHDWSSHDSDAFRYLALEADSVRDPSSLMSAQEAKQMYEQYARPIG